MTKYKFVNKVKKIIKNLNINIPEFRIEHSIKLSNDYLSLDKINIGFEIKHINKEQLILISSSLFKKQKEVTNFIEGCYNKFEKDINAVCFGYVNEEVEIYFQGTFSENKKYDLVISYDENENVVYNYDWVKIYYDNAVNDKTYINKLLNLLKKYNLEINPSHLSYISFDINVMKKTDTYHLNLNKNFSFYSYFLTPLMKKINPKGIKKINKWVKKYGDEKITWLSFNFDKEFISVYCTPEKKDSFFKRIINLLNPI